MNECTINDKCCENKVLSLYVYNDISSPGIGSLFVYAGTHLPYFVVRSWKARSSETADHTDDVGLLHTNTRPHRSIPLVSIVGSGCTYRTVLSSMILESRMSLAMHDLSRPLLTYEIIVRLQNLSSMLSTAECFGAAHPHDHESQVGTIIHGANGREFL